MGDFISWAMCIGVGSVAILALSDANAGQLIAAVVLIGGQIITVWRADQAARSSKENKGAIDLGNSKTDHLAKSTKIVHDQWNSRLDEFNLLMAANNQKMIDQATSLMREERDRVVAELTTKIAVLEARSAADHQSILLERAARAEGKSEGVAIEQLRASIPTSTVAVPTPTPIPPSVGGETT